MTWEIHASAETKAWRYALQRLSDIEDSVGRNIIEHACRVATANKQAAWGEEIWAKVYGEKKTK
jgi:hypothetical protein